MFWKDYPWYQRHLDACKTCTACSLHRKRSKDPVIWRGNDTSKVMLIGEAPGSTEEQTGIPFTGPAGQLLEKCFSFINIDINDIFITNVTKCRPVAPHSSGKKNITPTTHDMRTCVATFLWQEIDIIQPKLIIACGKSAAVGLNRIGPTDRVSDVINTIGSLIWRSAIDIPIITMRHPAAFLYPMTADKRQLIDDEYVVTWQLIASEIEKLQPIIKD